MHRFCFPNKSSKRLLADNFVFRLHYRWTVLILIACSCVVTCRLVLGHSFSCETTEGVPQSHLETHCYSETVHTFPVQVIKDHEPSRTILLDSRSHGYRRQQSFYPWVNLLLLVHALNFYWPSLIWKSYESGFFSRLTSGLEMVGNNEQDRGSELCFLAKYVLATQGKHKMYTAVYFLCEVLNYAIALAQTLWLVHFFDVTGVPDFLPFHITTWWTFRQFYFPPSGVCTITLKNFHHQTTCLLPLNDLYMYMFLFLHAWYIFLTIMSGLALIYRIVLLAPSPRVTSLRLSAPLVNKESVKSLCHRLSYSDWFFLTRFLRVMTDVDFAQMVGKMEVVSVCKSCGDSDLENNGSILSEDSHKELESSIATSPV